MFYRNHSSPVWREKSNAIVQAKMEDDAGSEQLWCRALGDETFEVCCIPFYLHDLALGDIIVAPEFHFQKVVKPSGRFVFRVYLREDQHKWREALETQLREISALFEWYSAGLLSIDAPDLKQAETISGWLLDNQRRGLLTYETGKL
jgi:hypothetical protein